MTIPERIIAPTPKLFKVIRSSGIVLSALAAALISMKDQGVELPQVADVFGNVATFVAGVIATIVSSLTG